MPPLFHSTTLGAVIPPTIAVLAANMGGRARSHVREDEGTHIGASPWAKLRKRFGTHTHTGATCFKEGRRTNRANTSGVNFTLFGKSYDQNECLTHLNSDQL